MRPTDMHRMAHRGCHAIAPKGWRDVPVMSGDYDMDATILHRNNKNLPQRLNLYLKKGSHNAYGSKTGYSDRDAYSGDD